MMTALPLLLVLLRSPLTPQTGEDPRAVVRAAALAMRGDSAPAVAARWSARLQRDSTDRAAALGLATLARLRYEYEDAERRYRRIFGDDSSRGASLDRYDAYARIGLARGMEAQGVGGEPVIAHFRRALTDARATNDRAAVGLAQFYIGNVLAPAGGIAEAFQYFDSAMSVLPPDADDVRSLVRCRRGQIFVAIAHPGSADTMRAAEAFATRANDDDAQAICLRGVALDHMLAGRLDSMAIVDRALVDLRRRMRDRSGLAIALTLQADHLRSQGNFGRAQPIFREALSEARASHNHYIEATVALGMGGTALTLNDHATAAEYVERAVSAFEAAHDSGSLMLALSFRPFISMAAGDLPAARRQSEVILGFWRHIQDWEQLAETLMQRSVIEMRAGDYAAAARALDEADAALRRVPRPASIASVAYHRGQLALYRGDLAGAERGFRRYVTMLDSASHLLRYDGRVRLAEVHARRGDAAAADRELAGAGAELDTWRASLSDPEMRTLAFQASPFEANDRNASVATVLAALVRGGRGTSAFALAERRRARDLAERMTRTRALLEQDAAAGARDSSGHDSLSAARSLTLAEAAGAIPDERTALLEYVTGARGAPTSLFVVTRDGANGSRAHVLRSADSLVADIGRLVSLLEGGDDPRELESALGSALLDSAVRALPASVTRLVIVPDGPLHRVPWDALRLADGRYAAERFAIGIAPSATVLARLSRERRDAGHGTRLLAFGDPAFPEAKASEEGEVYRSAFAETGGLPRLPSSAREARLVARYADDANVRLRDDASAEYLERTPLAGYDVLHFATHALVDDRAATRNALALAPGGTDADGFVAAADLAALHLDADLVVLSACRSAGGVVVDGEGVQGLTAPLLAAGARSVVATTWRISDRATVPFVEAFYSGMARGLPVAEALRAAKLDAMRRGAPPRDWAAFTAVGDPFAIVPLHEPARAWHLWALVPGGLVVIAAALWLLMRTRRAAPPARVAGAA
ncbi:MAG TPA: CHAT domain-containing tetratricopeptide repeat protein [Gemmatimonadaceae bacterium]|nr:CHAT domain-containing tetratricopeptide repeat protein [Gemmatimonadaceae bacterium]